jgi:hypothetical protein
MHLVELVHDPSPGADWADQTRRVLTRDLLVRASHAQPGEARALEFRALHLNLPLVGEVAGRLGLAEAQRTRVEHAALDGLHEAVRLFDPYGAVDFAAFAGPFVERQILAHQPVPIAAPSSRRTDRHPVRLAVRRLALVISGSRV